MDSSAPTILPPMGSSPKHAIYALIIYSQVYAIGICHVKATKRNKKRSGLANLTKIMLSRYLIVIGIPR